MAIHNPVPPLVKKAKANPKVIVIALGGGVVLYLLFRSHKSNTTGDNASLTDPSVSDTLSSPGTGPMPTQGATDPYGSGSAVDLSTPSTDPGIDGVGAVDDTASGTTDLGSLTLNIVGTPTDSPSGKDNSPGSNGATNAKKSVSITKIKTLSDLPYATRSKIQKERKAGNVDRFGRTPTERSAARQNAGIKKQLDQRLARQRAHKAAGGPTTRQHPTVTHTAPKRGRVRQAPVAHIEQPKQSAPKKQPNPPKQKRARSKA